MFGKLTASVFGFLSVFTLDNLKALPKKLFWCYVGLLYFAFGAGIWPWVIFQFWDNAQSGGNVIVDWERQPEAKNHSQILMYKVAMLCKPSFEYAMECFGA